MSDAEGERLYLVKLTGVGSLTQRDASERLGIGERQFSLNPAVGQTIDRLSGAAYNRR